MTIFCLRDSLAVSLVMRLCACSVAVASVNGCGELSKVQSIEQGSATPGSEAPQVDNTPPPQDNSPEEPEREEEIVQIDSTGAESTTTRVYQGEVDSSLVSVQVKSLSLLRASIVGCFGNDSMTLLSRDMFQDHSHLTTIEEFEFEEQGKRRIFESISPYAARYTSGLGSTLRFIDPTTQQSVDFHDVLAIEAVNLNDVTQGIRTTVSADGLSDRYLRALELVGQVVAHRCDLDDPMCDCKSAERAEEMILRCLPTLDVKAEALQRASQSMAAQCSQGHFEHRQAIASLVSSYAFAVRR